MLCMHSFHSFFLGRENHLKACADRASASAAASSLAMMLGIGHRTI